MSKPSYESYFRSMSTLLWLVLFVFGILLVSLILAGVIWQSLTHLDILMPFEEGNAAISTFLFLLIISLLISTVLATIVGEYFLRPLHRLTIATKEIARGNFDVYVDAKSSQELERLADSFNEMAKELKSIETLRADFVSNISHEFKTPVTSIRGFAKRLMKEGLSEAQRTEYLNIIVSESERLSRLSSNVLLLSNLEAASTLHAERVKYSLDEQLRKLILILEPHLQKKRLEVDIQLESVSITAAEELLYHVWLNLLSNAIKFSYLDGIVKINLKSEEHHAIIKISDQGMGMDDETLRHMFDKFYQGERSRATEGNGLGLSLVKKILDIEKGQITVHSAIGIGTQFIIILPI
ncbi:MAG: HAMP domain-containing histidine kinase [Defluviitaleaceae bacterium]|nr:HAMP domain-containing histidine kinase [Defluviitaleaceae bacterium]